MHTIGEYTGNSPYLLLRCEDDGLGTKLDWLVKQISDPTLLHPAVATHRWGRKRGSIFSCSSSHSKSDSKCLAEHSGYKHVIKRFLESTQLLGFEEEKDEYGRM